MGCIFNEDGSQPEIRLSRNEPRNNVAVSVPAVSFTKKSALDAVKKQMVDYSISDIFNSRPTF